MLDAGGLAERNWHPTFSEFVTMRHRASGPL
jgi:hypothetical protein